MKLKNKNIKITCDGGAATGKSTGARLIAKKYKLAFVGSRNHWIRKRPNEVVQCAREIL